MRTTDPRIDAIEVDGQTLFVPDASAWAELALSRELDGRPIASGTILERHLALAERASDLVVALGDEGAPGKPWVVHHLVRVPDGFARVLVEGQTCFACGWSGLTGNARDYQIHVGTKDPLEALRRATERPTIACPGCMAPLARPAIVAFRLRAE